METATMGRVLTEITVESLKDLWDAERGMIPYEKVRRVTIPDALVDTGAATLALPSRLIQQLGLAKTFEKRGSSSTVITQVSVYETVRITVKGRSCGVDVIELPDEVPALLGQIPLEMLDLVVDPVGRRLTGNPAHGGEQMLELY
jgi:predicted aspartyl protease